MKKVNLLLLCAATALTFASSCSKDDDNDNNTTSTLNSTDKDFMTKAAYSNNAEIEAGHLAQTKGTDTNITNFGTLMIVDHTKMQDSVTKVASQKSYTLPTGLDSAGASMKAILSSPSLTGRAFDSTYIHMMVGSHAKSLANHTNEMTNGMDADVKRVATNGKPIVQMHYDMAMMKAMDY